MRLLLDTHALLWWFDGDRRLPGSVRRLIESSGNEILVSAASVWEIATKARNGKLPDAVEIARRLPDAIASQGFSTLPITVDDAQAAGWLSSVHRDPFDRILAAQTQLRRLTLASNDPFFAALGVSVAW